MNCESYLRPRLRSLIQFFFFLKKSEQLKAIILQDPEYAYKNFVEEGLDKNEI